MTGHLVILVTLDLECLDIQVVQVILVIPAFQDIQVILELVRQAILVYLAQQVAQEHQAILVSLVLMVAQEHQATLEYLVQQVVQARQATLEYLVQQVVQEHQAILDYKAHQDTQDSVEVVMWLAWRVQWTDDLHYIVVLAVKLLETVLLVLV